MSKSDKTINDNETAITSKKAESSMEDGLVQNSEQNNLSQKPQGREYESQLLKDLTFKARSMLNAIIGFSELLESDSLTESQEDYVHEINQTSNSLVRLVEDTLLLSRLENNKIKPDYQTFSLTRILDELYSLSEPAAEKKGLKFEIKQLTELPRTISTDMTILSQILWALVSNGIEYTDKGSVSVNVSMVFSAEGPSIVFEVKDTGAGIDFFKQSTVFESFVQVRNDMGVTRPGLGLSLAWRLAKILGGELALSSKSNKGTVFSLWIPANCTIGTETPLLEYNYDPAAKNSAEKTENVASVESPKCTGHVLLVEDDPSNREVISSMLGIIGLEVTTAEDGLDALEKIDGCNCDLILMDIYMPRMNGFEAACALREKGYSVPIIALTAKVLSEHDDRKAVENFDSTIIKPVNKKKLSEVVSRYLPSFFESKRLDSKDSERVVDLNPVLNGDGSRLSEKTETQEQSPADKDDDLVMFLDDDNDNQDSAKAKVKKDDDGSIVIDFTDD